MHVFKEQHLTNADQPAVTVYTKPACAQCRMTTKWLDKNHIYYKLVDVTKNPEALEHILGLGYMAAPVVQVDEDIHWSGFRPDCLNEYVRESDPRGNG